MKLFHLSDLHLGARVCGYSLLEDQAYILARIVELAREERPDAVLIAGDVYDKAVPPAEAVTMLDGFLYELSRACAHVLVVSGNHDSPERLAFGGRLMSTSGVVISPVYDGHVEPVTLGDEHGEVEVYLLPFVKPVNVRRFFPDDGIDSFTDAMRAAIARMSIDPAKRSVLVSHQFVTGAQRSGSEEEPVGGAENVDAAVFAPFDYVALGHLHGSQRAGRDTIRYCGAPLKYSFAEARQQKSVTVVTLGAKGDVGIRLLPLTPLRDLREIRGSYMEVSARDFYRGANVEDYLRVTLTDENEVPYARAKLGAIYPNIMLLDYDNRRSRAGAAALAAEEMRGKTPLELFEALYRKQNGAPMSDEQRGWMREQIGKAWEDEA